MTSSSHKATGGSRNRRRRRLVAGAGGDEHSGGAGMERWLLTYSDMITLLMALFIVMWAVSAVNVTKYEQLRRSLSHAFGGSGKVLDKDKSVLDGQTGILQGGKTQQPAPETEKTPEQQQAAAAEAEAQTLARLKFQIDTYAVAHGLEKRLNAVIEERGLVVRLLTDDLLFDTGEAVLKPRAWPVLKKVTVLLERTAGDHDLRVAGNTDDVPIRTALFHSNWELSSARAAAVLERLRVDGIPERHLSLAGYADQRPVSTNATAAGRALNRRVDLVVVRKVFAQ